MTEQGLQGLSTIIFIETQLGADMFLDARIKYFMKKTGADRSTATVVVKNDIGYYAGGFSDDVRRRVEKLFQCQHSFFGPIDEVGPPGPEKAFQMGIEMGKSNFIDLL